MPPGVVMVKVSPTGEALALGPLFVGDGGVAVELAQQRVVPVGPVHLPDLREVGRRDRVGEAGGVVVDLDVGEGHAGDGLHAGNGAHRFDALLRQGLGACHVHGDDVGLHGRVEDVDERRLESLGEDGDEDHQAKPDHEGGGGGGGAGGVAAGVLARQAATGAAEALERPADDPRERADDVLGDHGDGDEQQHRAAGHLEQRVVVVASPKKPSAAAPCRPRPPARRAACSGG